MHYLFAEPQNLIPISSGTRHGRAIVQKTMIYIDTHLCDSLRMEDVCLKASVHIRTLQRYFSKFLRLTPNKYLELSRLNLFNRFLSKVNKKNAKVGQSAYSFGFDHLGRMCRSYKALFRETPSQTLRNQKK